MLPAETLIWVPVNEEESVAIAGHQCLSPRECDELARLLSKSSEWDPSGCLILNDVQSRRLGARFPGIINLIALSVGENNPVGWLLALNKSDVTAVATRSPALDSPRSHLRIAFTLARYCRGETGDRPLPAYRYCPAVALRVASGTPVEQFAPSIPDPGALRGPGRLPDGCHRAKDPYTFGHSERVGRIAVELGRELGLPEPDLGDIYLAGLLHDIGKIGVPDSILGKTSPSLRRIHADPPARDYRMQDPSRLSAVSHLLPLVLITTSAMTGRAIRTE